MKALQCDSCGTLIKDDWAKVGWLTLERSDPRFSELPTVHFCGMKCLATYAVAHTEKP